MSRIYIFDFQGKRTSALNINGPFVLLAVTFVLVEIGTCREVIPTQQRSNLLRRRR